MVRSGDSTKGMASVRGNVAHETPSGFAHVAIDRQGSVWCGYHDEGIFGGTDDEPVGAYGLVRFDSLNEPSWTLDKVPDGFDLIEASFSMITAPPATLLPAQRAPHFDSTDPDYIAILHYLSDTPGTGTAFYRQRATGIEVVDEANLSRFVTTARRDAAARPATYINGTDAHFEQIAAVEGVPDRLVIYRGNLLHSGIIPLDMSMSDNPRIGRLTANLFVKGRRG